MSEIYPYQLVEDGAYVVIRAQEDITDESSARLAASFKAAVLELGCSSFLVDRRGARVRASTLDLYRRPELVDEEVRYLAGAQVAFLYSQDESDFRFLENVCQNRGINVRIFRETHEATAWLLGRDPALAQP